jgi:CRP-like cAMP-binding protein
MQISNSIIDFYISHPIAKGLSEDEIKILYRYTKMIALGFNVIVVHENEASRDLYFIFEGEVQLLKSDDEQKLQLSIGNLPKGEMFGEMSFLDGLPRSSTVVTATPSVLLKLSYEIAANNEPFIKEIYYKILHNIATINIKRLRITNENYVRSLRAEIDQLNLRNSFGILFIFLILVVGIANIVDNLARTYGIDTHTAFFSWSYLMSIFIPSILIVNWIGCPLADIGVTTKNWKESAIQGIIISILLVAILVIGYWLYAMNNPSTPSFYVVLTNPVRKLDFFALIYFFTLIFKNFWEEVSFNHPYIGLWGIYKMNPNRYT